MMHLLATSQAANSLRTIGILDSDRKKLRNMNYICLRNSKNDMRTLFFLLK